MNRRTTLKAIGTGAAIAMLALSTACGGTALTIARAGLAFAIPVIEASGLSSDKVRMLVADVNTGIDDVAGADVKIKAIPSSVTGAELAARKAQIYFDLAQQLRVLLGHYHIGDNPKVDRVVAIFQGVIDGLEAYYHTVHPPTGAANLGRNPDVALKAVMEKAQRDMKALANEK